MCEKRLLYLFSLLSFSSSVSRKPNSFFMLLLLFDFIREKSMARPLGWLAIIGEPSLSASSESPYLTRLPRPRLSSTGGAVTLILGSKIGIFITLSRSLVDSCLFTKAIMVSSDCFEVKSSKASLIKFL